MIRRIIRIRMYSNIRIFAIPWFVLHLNAYIFTNANKWVTALKFLGELLSSSLLDTRESHCILATDSNQSP